MSESAARGESTRAAPRRCILLAQCRFYRSRIVDKVDGVDASAAGALEVCAIRESRGGRGGRLGLTGPASETRNRLVAVGWRHGLCGPQTDHFGPHCGPRAGHSPACIASLQRPLRRLLLRPAHRWVFARHTAGRRRLGLAHFRSVGPRRGTFRAAAGCGGSTSLLTWGGIRPRMPARSHRPT